MKYNFDFYPPTPAETSQPQTNPEMLPELIHICDGVWVAPDNPEPWLATGDYLNIEDFWLVSNPPKRSDLIVINGISQLKNKIYLSGATYAFQRFCYMLAEQNKDMDAGKASSELYHKHLNPYNVNPYRDRVLLETQIVKDHSDSEAMKKLRFLGFGPKSLLIIKRVIDDILPLEEPDIFPAEEIQEATE